MPININPRSLSFSEKLGLVFNNNIDLSFLDKKFLDIEPSVFNFEENKAYQSSLKFLDLNYQPLKRKSELKRNNVFALSLVLLDFMYGK